MKWNLELQSKTRTENIARLFLPVMRRPNPLRSPRITYGKRKKNTGDRDAVERTVVGELWLP